VNKVSCEIVKLKATSHLWTRYPYQKFEMTGTDGEMANLKYKQHGSHTSITVPIKDVESIQEVNLVDTSELKNDLQSVLKKHDVSLEVREYGSFIGSHEEFVAVDASGDIVAVLNSDHGYISAKQLSS